MFVMFMYEVCPCNCGRRPTHFETQLCQECYDEVQEWLWFYESREEQGEE